MSGHWHSSDLPRQFEQARVHLISIESFSHVLNPMNTIYRYNLAVVDQCSRQENFHHALQCPRAEFVHKRFNDRWGIEGEFAYRENQGISCLFLKHGVLMSHG